MSKLLCNVVKISGGANAPHGCAPDANDQTPCGWKSEASVFRARGVIDRG